MLWRLRVAEPAGMVEVMSSAVGSAAALAVCAAVGDDAVVDDGSGIDFTVAVDGALPPLAAARVDERRRGGAIGEATRRVRSASRNGQKRAVNETGAKKPAERQESQTPR